MFSPPDMMMSFGLSGAEAKTKVNIYLGVPHYGYQVGPDYVYRKGHGWYRPSRNCNRLSCGQAPRTTISSWSDGKVGSLS